VTDDHRNRAEAFVTVGGISLLALLPNNDNTNNNTNNNNNNNNNSSNNIIIKTLTIKVKAKTIKTLPLRC